MPGEPRAFGAATCACCGEELELTCPASRLHEGVVIATDPAHEARVRITAKRANPGTCSVPRCGQPVAAYTGRGRPPRQCERHLRLVRAQRDRWEAKRAERLQGDTPRRRRQA